MPADADRTRRPLVLAEAASILGRTPPTLQVLLDGLPDPWINAHEGAETWSPFDVLGHLIHGERTDWMPRVRIILEQGESRTFPPFDRFAQFQESHGRTVPDLLAEFAALRQSSLSDLVALKLSDSDLARTGRHPAFGVVTLRQLLATWVAHDLDHIVQIARVMAKQYSEEVGPWRAYLGVINRS